MRKVYSYIMTMKCGGDSAYRQFLKLYNANSLIAVQARLKEYTTRIQSPSEGVIKLILFDRSGAKYFMQTTLEIASNILMMAKEHNNMSKYPYIYITSD